MVKPYFPTGSKGSPMISGINKKSYKLGSAMVGIVSGSKDGLLSTARAKEIEEDEKALADMKQQYAEMSAPEKYYILNDFFQECLAQPDIGKMSNRFLLTEKFLKTTPEFYNDMPQKHKTNSRAQALSVLLDTEPTAKENGTKSAVLLRSLLLLRNPVFLKDMPTKERLQNLERYIAAGLKEESDKKMIAYRGVQILQDKSFIADGFENEVNDIIDRLDIRPIEKAVSFDDSKVIVFAPVVEHEPYRNTVSRQILAFSKHLTLCS